METLTILNGILFVGLIFFLMWEIRSYNKFVESAKNLTLLGAAVQAAFEGVSKDVADVNDNLTVMNIKVDRLDEATDTLNSNDALIEVYLNLFRDALGLEAEKLSRIGSLHYTDKDGQVQETP